MLADLKDNAVTDVIVPPMKAGTHTLTCGMGMMSGSIVAGTVAASAGWTPWAITAALAALLAIGYGIYHGRHRKAVAHPAAHAPDGTMWGFQPFELVIAATIIIVAIVIGLVSGGFFR